MCVYFNNMGATKAMFSFCPLKCHNNLERSYKDSINSPFSIDYRFCVFAHEKAYINVESEICKVFAIKLTSPINSYDAPMQIGVPVNLELHIYQNV